MSLSPQLSVGFFSPSIENRQHSESLEDETRRLNETEQLGERLKAETGYSSYKEYMAAHEELRETFDFLPIVLFHEKDFESTCFILDLLRTPNSGVKLSVRCETPSAAKILTNLRHPPVESSLQILLWSADGVDPDLVSALGLGLKIDPSFFVALCQKAARTRRAVYNYSCFDYGGPFTPTYLEIDEKIVTIAGHHTHIAPRSVPVVLIAGKRWNLTGIAESISDLSLSPNSGIDPISNETPDPLQWQRYEAKPEITLDYYTGV